MPAADVAATPSWWLLTAVLLLGAVMGAVVGARLSTTGYRLPQERGKPLPRYGWLPAVVVPIIWALLVWRLHGQHTPALLPPFLLLGLLAVVLSWTDLDVHRLPEQITLPAVPALVALLAITSAATRDWAALGRAVLFGAGGFLFFFVLVMVTAGGVGRGDATLAALVSIPTGHLGWRVALTAVTLGLAVSGIVAISILATRPHRRGAEMALGRTCCSAAWLPPCSPARQRSPGRPPQPTDSVKAPRCWPSPGRWPCGAAARTGLC